jgi:hypothetical protein
VHIAKTITFRDVPIANAYIRIDSVVFDRKNPSVSGLSLGVYASEASQDEPPITTIEIRGGQPFANGERFRTHDELLAGVRAYLEGFAAIAATLYAEAIAKHPELQGGTLVTP